MSLNCNLVDIRDRARLLAKLGGVIALATVWLAAGRSAAGQAEPETEPETETAEPADSEADVLPKLEEMEIPTAEELLTGSPRDWIILKNSDVIVCEPIVPRPNTLELRQQEIDRKTLEQRGKKGAELTRIRDELNDLRYLEFTIPEDLENPEYRIEIIKIDRFLHHEDLMLLRIDELIAEGRLDTAFELLVRLKKTWDDWRGTDARHDNLLFADAKQRLEAGDPERALVTLTELNQRTPAYPGLSEQAGNIIDGLVTAALSEGDVRMARHFLFRLDAMYPQHEVFTRHSGALTQKTNELLSAAEAAQAAGQLPDAARLARDAALLWPRTPGLMARYRPIAERYQQLHVGVVHLAGEINSSPFESPADARARQLTDVPLFERDRFRNGTAYYRTRYFDEWEPFDLGRRLQITLRQTRQTWEVQPLIDAPQLASLLEARLDPASQFYDERLAWYVDSIRVQTPVELTVSFRRVPPRVEPLLDEIVPTRPEPTSEVVDSGQVSLDEADSGQPDLSDADTIGGFVRVATDESDVAVYRRAVPERDDLPQYHVAEVIEHRYPSHEKALQALKQGDISLLPDLPDWILRRLQRDDDLAKSFFIQQYAIPTTHVVQFNPQSRPLRIREVRRALAYALDRQAILADTVLRDIDTAHGRVVSSPFPSSSPANSLDVEPRSYDFSAAFALMLAGARQLDGTIPVLKMHVPAGEVEQAAAKQLVRAWKRIKIEVEILPPDADPATPWDLHYRTVQLVSPTLDIWPFLTGEPTARMSDLKVFPDWLQQQMIALDRTSDLGRSLASMRRLHEALWSEVRFLPLWEVDGFLVIRKNALGFRQRPIHCYHDIDRWTLSAWFPTE